MYNVTWLSIVNFNLFLFYISYTGNGYYVDVYLFVTETNKNTEIIQDNAFIT